MRNSEFGIRNVECEIRNDSSACECGSRCAAKSGLRNPHSRFRNPQSAIRNCGSGAFSLVEMLVVIGIIGVIISMVLVVGGGAVQDAKVKDTFRICLFPLPLHLTTDDVAKRIFFAVPTDRSNVVADNVISGTVAISKLKVSPVVTSKCISFVSIPIDSPVPNRMALAVESSIS